MFMAEAASSYMEEDCDMVQRAASRLKVATRMICFDS
jgi:hypothetical protein